MQARDAKLRRDGHSSGPKMIKAAALSSTDPITIRIAIESSMKSQVPLVCVR
jgi:hypothetical protein